MITTETKLLVGVLVATVLLVVGGAYWVSRSTAALNEPVSQPERLVREDDAITGFPEAKVTVVEFGDFQCPACGALYPVLKQVKDNNGAKSVRFVYRHFPLPQHEFAPLAAEAAVEAQQQGKFWEMHNLLFEHQDQLTRADLEKYAEELKLDMTAFRKALDEHTHQTAVESDKTDGEALGITGTPTLYINAVQYRGNYAVADLEAAIDAELKK